MKYDAISGAYGISINKFSDDVVMTYSSMPAVCMHIGVLESIAPRFDA